LSGHLGLTTTVWLVVFFRPALSVTVSTTTYDPAAVNVWLVAIPVRDGEPSPKSQRADVTLRPGAAFEPFAFALTSWPTTGSAGETVKLATGSGVVVTAIVTGAAEARAPRSSVTVSTTLYEPASWYRCAVLTPDPAPPSPKLQA
jgi:hypothetical protein